MTSLPVHLDLNLDSRSRSRAAAERSFHLRAALERRQSVRRNRGPRWALLRTGSAGSAAPELS